MAELQQQLHNQQKLRELGTATLRALVADGDCQIRPRGLYQGDRFYPIHAPHIEYAREKQSLIDQRAVADAMALRLRYSDHELHLAKRPDEPLRRLIFEWFEQLRVESLTPAHLPGVVDNLRQQFSAWSTAFHQECLDDSSIGLLLYTLVQMAWARINSCPVLEETADLIEATRAGLAPILGHQLVALKRSRLDQATYANAVLEIAEIIDRMIASERAVLNEPESEKEQSRTSSLSLLLDYDEDQDETTTVAASGQSRVFSASTDGYRVFERRYDRVHRAIDRVRPQLLIEMREQLDQVVRSQAVNMTRLARNLARVFTRPQRDGWNFGEESGYIDGRRLAQLVSSPRERGVFQLPRNQSHSDSLLTFLIDCSGSMKAQIEAIAALVDIFARAAQVAAIDTEVLGYSTGAWNGGRARKNWLAQGSPQYPGRLNEVSHTVYKHSDTHWRRARRDIAALLKPDLMREGIDGEAVEWACTRMRERSARHRVLVVISDGCPMDRATSLANDEFYLANHLQQVVRRIDQQGDIAVCGIGVGLDLDPYYRNSLVLDLSEGLNNRNVDEIVLLLERCVNNVLLGGSLP